MKYIRLFFIIVLGISTLNFYIPAVVFAEENQSFASANIKVYPIEIRSTPQIDIPKQQTKDDRSWISKNRWWVIGALAATIGGVAVAIDDSGEDEKPTGYSKGTATFSW